LLHGSSHAGCTYVLARPGVAATQYPIVELIVRMALERDLGWLRSHAGCSQRRAAFGQRSRQLGRPWTTRPAMRTAGQHTATLWFQRRSFRYAQV